MVHVQHLHLLLAFDLCSHLNALNCLCRLTFRLQQDQQHEVAFVIDQQKEGGLAAWGCWLDGPTDIAVHELQRLTDAIGCLNRKGDAPLLVNETPVAQPVHALDCR